MNGTPAASLLAALVLAELPASAQQPTGPYDVATYPVVVSVPGMDETRIVRGIRYAGEGDRALTLDVTYPRGAARRWPAVVFVNGVGGRLNDWEIYRSWARLVAAHGLAAVTFEADRVKPAESVRALFAYLVAHAGELSLDGTRVAAWSCSGNVRAALPVVMGEATGIKAAAFLYGSGEAPALRKSLPVFWVLAGRDDRGLIEGQKALWARAVREDLPWTMVSAPGLPHAFDALVEEESSKRLVLDVVEFLVSHLAPDVPAPEASPTRRALTFTFAHEYDGAAKAYRDIVAKEPSDRDAKRRLAVSEYNQACALALAGRKDDALGWLRRSVENGFGPRRQIETDPDLAGLRGESLFLEILAKAADGAER
jgi:dienelactone hydrolase